MRSIVTFDLVAAIPVEQFADYPSIGVTLKMNGQNWTGLSVEVEHNDNDGPAEIVERTRERVRDLLALIGVGRGIEPALGVAHVSSASAPRTEPTTGLIQPSVQLYTVRPLLAMPSEELVHRLDADPRLRRQAEALNAARVASDVVSQIRWSYMVLEQEKDRDQGYAPPDDYRYLRHAVSHPELNDAKGKAYFQSVLRVDFPDLKNPMHGNFLKSKARGLLQEAARIVEQAFHGNEFWQK